MNEFTPELKVILASIYVEIAATTDVIMKMALVLGIQHPKSLSELNLQRMETWSILFGKEQPPMKQTGADWGECVLFRPWDEKAFLASLKRAENTAVLRVGFLL